MYIRPEQIAEQYEMEVKSNFEGKGLFFVLKQISECDAREGV